MAGGSSSHLWSCAVYRSLAIDTVKSYGDSILSACRRTCEIALVEASSLSLSGRRGVPSCPAPVSSILSSATVRNLGSWRGWRSGQIASLGWRTQILNLPLALSNRYLEVSSRGFSWSISSVSYSPRRGAPLQGRNFASSGVCEQKISHKGRAGKANTSTGLQLKSSKRVFQSTKSKNFRGPLSSIKYLQSEHDTGKSKSKSVARGVEARKERLFSPGRSVLKAGRAPYNSSFSTKSKFKLGADNEGLKLKRRRKRIKPRPRDITYKRGLVDSETINDASDSVRQPGQDAANSLNARFRQIQPSRVLLAHIEENILGRRRLAEWRKAGYDPKRTAPLDDVPGSKVKRAPIMESVFKKKLTFIAAAKQSPSLPPPQYPEVAFAGRSNVGKSSLINALTRQWGAARTSPKPGLTKSINFFTLGSRLCVVDLPGYGFAYAKEEEKEGWEELVKQYVQTRPNLKRVCLVVDSRWGLKPRDEELLYLMESAGTAYQIVLTKTDILPPLDLARRATQILKVVENHKCFFQPLMMVSSKTGAGLLNFRASLEKIALPQSRMLEETASL